MRIGWNGREPRIPWKPRFSQLRAFTRQQTRSWFYQKCTRAKVDIQQVSIFPCVITEDASPKMARDDPEVLENLVTRHLGPSHASTHVLWFYNSARTPTHMREYFKNLRTRGLIFLFWVDWINFGTGDLLTWSFCPSLATSWDSTEVSHRLVATPWKGQRFRQAFLRTSSWDELKATLKGQEEHLAVPRRVKMCHKGHGDRINL